jgi:hypothetical protein
MNLKQRNRRAIQKLPERRVMPAAMPVAGSGFSTAILRFDETASPRLAEALFGDGAIA